MRTIGLSLCFAGLLLAAPQQTTPVQAITDLASDLSHGDAPSAIAFFDPSVPRYSEIRGDIEAITAQGDVSCAIEVVSDNEKDGIHTLELDWLISLKPEGANALERRREQVHAEMRLVKGHWRITAFTPITILAPIHVQ